MICRHLKNLLRVFAGIACALFSFGAGLAADDVSLTFQNQDGTYRLEGVFPVRADSATAWKVLTDYEHIPLFVGSMKKVPSMNGSSMTWFWNRRWRAVF